MADVGANMQCAIEKRYGHFVTPMWYEPHNALLKSKTIGMHSLPECVGKEWSSSIHWVDVSLRGWHFVWLLVTMCGEGIIVSGVLNYSQAIKWPIQLGNLLSVQIL